MFTGDVAALVCPDLLIFPGQCRGGSPGMGGTGQVPTCGAGTVTPVKGQLRTCSQGLVLLAQSSHRTGPGWGFAPRSSSQPEPLPWPLQGPPFPKSFICETVPCCHGRERFQGLETLLLLGRNRVSGWLIYCFLFIYLCVCSGKCQCQSLWKRSLLCQRHGGGCATKLWGQSSSQSVARHPVNSQKWLEVCLCINHSHPPGSQPGRAVPVPKRKENGFFFFFNFW